MDIDDCYEKVVGSIGRYQKWVLFLQCLNNCLLAPQTFLVVFIGSTPSELNKTNWRVENSSSILIEWNLMERKWIENIIQSMYFIGFLIGVVVIGQLSDRFGRKIVVLAGFHILFPICLMASFAYSWKTFAVCRFFTGFFTGGTGLVQFVLTQETIGKKVWAYTSLIGSASFALGIMLVSTIAYFCTPWRLLTRVVAMLQILPLIGLWSLTESPRWLYSNQRLVEAELVLKKIAARNGVRNPEFDLIIKKHSKDADRHYNLFDLLLNKISRKRLLIMSYLWFVNSLVYYALSLAATDVSDNLYLNESLQGFVEYPALVVCAFIINKTWCGRKRILSTAFFISGISCMAIVFYHNSDQKTVGKLVLAMTGKMMISTSFTIVYIYSPELFPTVGRSVAMGSLSMCARVGGIVASFSKTFVMFNALAAYLVFGLCGTTAGLLTLLLPETLGQKPPDTFTDLTNQTVNQKKNGITQLQPLYKNHQKDEDKIGLLAAIEHNKESE